MSLENLTKVIEKHKRKEHFYNFILILGDFANVNHDDPNLTADDQFEALKGITLVLRSLEDVRDISVPVPTLYVPGNHDPANMFLTKELGKPALTDFSINIHKEVYEIAEGL